MTRLGNPTKEQSYLSLSLLDENLEPILGASGAVNAFQAVFPRLLRGCPWSFSLSRLSNYRSNITKGNSKIDQLFMTASDSTTIIIPLDIRRVTGPTNDVLDWNTKIASVPVPMTVEEGKSSDVFYGSGINVRKPSSDLFYGTGIQVKFMNDLRPSPSGSKRMEHDSDYEVQVHGLEKELPRV